MDRMDARSLWELKEKRTLPLFFRLCARIRTDWQDRTSPGRSRSRRHSSRDTVGGAGAADQRLPDLQFPETPVRPHLLVWSLPEVTIVRRRNAWRRKRSSAHLLTGGPSHPQFKRPSPPHSVQASGVMSQIASWSSKVRASCIMSQHTQNLT